MEYDFLKWTGHAGFMLKTRDLMVFIDPFKLGPIKEHADVVFITHSHFDHLSNEDIGRIADNDTLFVSPSEAASKLRYKNIRIVKPGDRSDALGIRFEAVPAYNVNPKRLGFHPKGNGWVGYVIDADKRIYHAGDTDLIEEMSGIETDLALLPIGGTYTMDVDEAIQATKRIRAKHFAPMHYKTLLGKEGSADAERKFRENVKNSMILKETSDPSYSF